jgi:hemerythrin-like domain-containing protein
MLDEHQEIEAMVHINENIPDATLLGNLAQAIDDHIRFEERQLFPYAERVIPEKELNLIYDQLPKEKAECGKWEREFWVSKKTTK